MVPPDTFAGPVALGLVGELRAANDSPLFDELVTAITVLIEQNDRARRLLRLIEKAGE